MLFLVVTHFTMVVTMGTIAKIAMIAKIVMIARIVMTAMTVMIAIGSHARVMDQDRNSFFTFTDTLLNLYVGLNDYAYFEHSRFAIKKESTFLYFPLDKSNFKMYNYVTASRTTVRNSAKRRTSNEDKKQKHIAWY